MDIWGSDESFLGLGRRSKGFLKRVRKHLSRYGETLILKNSRHFFGFDL